MNESGGYLELSTPRHSKIIIARILLNWLNFSRYFKKKDPSVSCALIISTNDKYQWGNLFLILDVFFPLLNEKLVKTNGIFFDRQSFFWQAHFELRHKTMCRSEANNS